MSYTIYLFHVFFTAGMGELIGYVWPQMPVILIWLSCMACGVFGPIALYQFITLNWLTSFVFLGVWASGPPRRTPVLSAIETAFGKA